MTPENTPTPDTTKQTPGQVSEQASEHTPTTLFCFSYAGGSTSVFVRWKSFLPNSITLQPIEYPGRGTRFRDPLQTDFDTLVTGLVDHMVANFQPLLSKPYALYGHSLGTLVVFEVAHKLQDLGYPAPHHLFVSGRKAPHVPRIMPLISQLSDSQFLSAIEQDYQPLPSVIKQDPETLALFLGILKADFSVLESYRYNNHSLLPSPLPCPITAIGGDRDPIANEELLSTWAAHTTKAFRTVIIPGDHYSMVSEPGALIKEIVRDMNGDR